MFTSGKSSNSTAAIHSSLGQKATPAMTIPRHPAKRSPNKMPLQRAASSPDLYSSPESTPPPTEEKNANSLPLMEVTQPRITKNAVSGFETFKDAATADILRNRPGLANAPNNAVKRTVSHLIKDAVDVLSAIPRTETEAKAMTLLHYEGVLTDTIIKTLQEAGSKYKTGAAPYLSNNAKQMGGIKQSSNNKPAKKSYFLGDPKEPKKAVIFKDAKVCLFICYGYPPRNPQEKVNSGYLTGEKLQDVVNFYLHREAASINIYLGDYDDIKDLEQDVNGIGLSKRQQWLDDNQAWLLDKDDRIKIVLREDLITTKDHGLAKEFVYQRIVNNKLSYTQWIEKDAAKYINGQLENESSLLLKNSGSKESLSSSPSNPMYALVQQPLKRSGSNSSQQKSPGLRPNSRPTSPDSPALRPRGIEEKVALLQTLLDDFKDLPTDPNFDRQAYIESATFAAARILSFSPQELSSSRETSPQHNESRVSRSASPPSINAPQSLSTASNHGSMPLLFNKGIGAASESTKNMNMLLPRGGGSLSPSKNKK